MLLELLMLKLKIEKIWIPKGLCNLNGYTTQDVHKSKKLFIL